MQVIQGRLTDERFRDRRCYIVYAVNAISIDPYGIAKDLKEIYPYENTHDVRKRLYSLPRATVESRDEPGCILIHGPPAITDNLPHLIACVTQYGYGEAIDSNERAQLAMTRSKDLHYANGLKMDTVENRRQSFQDCLKKIVGLAMDDNNVERVIIPEGLGCRGQCQNEWHTVYVPMLETMADRLKPYGVETFLVKKPK